jgi:hypothetical protein
VGLNRRERRDAAARLLHVEHERAYREDAMDSAAESALAAVRARAELMTGRRSERRGPEALENTLFRGASEPIEDLVDEVLHDVDRYGDAYTETLIRFLIELSAAATAELSRVHEVSPKKVVKALASAIED